MAEFSFEEAAVPATKKEFSFEEVMAPEGKPSVEAPTKGEFSFEDATGATPPTTAEAAPSAGVMDHLASLAVKGPISGAKGMVSSSLQGVAGWQADRPGYPAGQSPLEQASRGEDQAFETYNQGPKDAPLPTKEHPLYQAGEAISDFGSEALKPAPGSEFAFDVGSGFGSVVGGIGLSLISPTAAGLAFISGGAGESTERAVKAGATPQQIAAASRLGTIAGATDVVDALLPTLGTPGKVLDFLGKVGKKVVIGALAEGGQEAVQQLIQNAIAKGIYKPDQSLGEGVAYNALIGAIVGGAAKPVLDRTDPQTKATPEATNAAFNELVSTPPPQPPPPDVTKLPETVAPAGPTIQPVPSDAPPAQPMAIAPQTAAAPTTTKVDAFGNAYTPSQVFDPGYTNQTRSPIEELLVRPPATPTEAFLEDRSPFSPDASDARAQAQIAVGAVNEQLPLMKKRLELTPPDEMSMEDVLASSDIRASLSNITPVSLVRDENVHIYGDKGPRIPGRVVILDTERLYKFNVNGVEGEVIVEPRDDGKHLHIRWVGEGVMGGTPNILGPSATRGILKALKKEFPSAKTIGGNRNSGARGKETDVIVPIRYNLTKLTPQAAAVRGDVEERVLQAFRQFHQEQQNAKLARAAVEQVAGAKVAARTRTPRSIPMGKFENVKGWGNDPNLLPDESSGFYSPPAEASDVMPLIYVATAGSQERSIVTAYHEGWHAIEGTLLPEEVATLRNETEALRAFISAKNSPDADLYAVAEPEEIWAEAAAFYSYAQTMERTKIYNGPAASVFDKIQALLQRIKAIVRSMGFEKSGDIFQAFYNGEMASRREGLPGDMLERWWANEAGYSADLSASNSKIEANTSRNEAALGKIDPGITHVPAQLDTLVLHNGVRKLYAMTHGATAVPPPVAQALAHADVMSKRHAWMWGLDRLVDLNPRFTPLLRYAELIREMRTDASKIQDKALSIAKGWRRLGKQMDNLGQFIDHISNMNYRTPVEVQNGTLRHPTQQEFQAAVQQFAVSQEALQIFTRQKNFFQVFLSMTTKNAMDEAQRTISDPVELFNKINAIKAKEAQLLSKPYFPFMRFGRHYVQVKDAQGNVLLFETYERKGYKSAEMVQKAAQKFYQSKLQPGQTISIGVLTESAQPFIGLPPELLESIQRDLAGMVNAQGQSPGLTAQQINAIEQLRYAVAPAASFAHRFQNKDYVSGYSDDFLRAFSRYAFQGSRYYSRVKYGWALRKQQADAVRIGKASSDNKIGAIANYMDDHLYHTVLDSKGDFGFLKGGIFLWVFGYSVAGATLNLSQVPMVTYPWLAAKFGGIGVGDGRALKALARAGTQLENFYKKGSYANQTAFEMKAIDYGVKTGRISESQAAELAGLAQGNTLLGQGNDKFRRGAQHLMEQGTWLFEMAEQYNRRITFRAALELAKSNPNSKASQEAGAKYADEIRQMVQSGTFSPIDALHVATAIHAVEQTQFVYARENRPRFMRGRLAGTILVFKTYLLNVLQLMGANKGSVMPRQLLMLLAMGGIMGLPGADDLEDVINILGKQLFGKDFNVQRQLREFLVESVGDKADVVLHGLSRRGFGIPALVDMLGSAPGRGLGSGHSNNVPFPVLDRSKAVSMGRILPFDLGSLADPNDVDKAIAQNTQQASGAVFGVGFNLYRALMDSSTDGGDLKRWERAMPRAVASASRAYRAYSEERTRGKGGPNAAPSIINFDPRDPEQVAEIAAMALGYTPLRQSAKWDLIMAQAETEKKLQIEQKLVLQNRFEAQMGGRDDEIEKATQAIIDYNDKLPDWARGYKVSGDTLMRSMEAKMRDRNAKEAGIPLQNRNKPVADYLQSLFPEAVVDVRKVR